MPPRKISASPIKMRDERLGVIKRAELLIDSVLATGVASTMVHPLRVLMMIVVSSLVDCKDDVWWC